MNLDFSNINVLLVGDFMLDHYLYGVSNRDSPENPVPVICPTKEDFFAGGAGNVAMNVVSLGGKVVPVGIIGNDFNGKILLNILEKSGINKDFLLQTDSYRTTTKKRIFSNDHPIARIDHEDIVDNSILINDMFQKIKSSISDIDVLIISDYNKGVIDERFSQLLIDLCNENKIPIIVDPKKLDFKIYKNATIITPNFLEIQNVLKIFTNFDSISSSCHSLIEKLNIDALVVTRSEEGISLIKNNKIFSVNGKKIKNPDVTGGGDTVISALALSYTAGNTLEDSITIANFAATSVVRKQGTAYATTDSIREESLIK
tara:strand:- start:2791 stop:3738 length:948 start_codon:yes stop_codon:yes gene_type:complete